MRCNSIKIKLPLQAALESIIFPIKILKVADYTIKQTVSRENKM